MKNISPLLENDFTLFQNLLVSESGLYFDRDRIQFLRIALWERIQKRGYNSYEEYYHFLKFHPEGKIEIRELIDIVTIGETYFFRNQPHFEVLTKCVLPELIERRRSEGKQSLRIWSAGCSRGDEPYSIAIAIIEALPDYKNWDISILATDINRNVLEKAREAVYGDKDIRYSPPEYFNKYFLKRGAKFILSDKIKELVCFENHNLARDSYSLEGMGDLDIVFCRNVTIYFDLDTTKRVVETFYDCLNEEGYLFLGHSETLWQITKKFESINFPQTFIYRKAAYETSEEMRPFMAIPDLDLDNIFSNEKTDLVIDLPEENIISEKPAEEMRSSEEDDLYKQAAKKFEEKEYDEALSLFDEIISKDREHINSYFAKATIFANQAKYEDAVNELDKIIKVDNLYIEAYYLLGVLFYKTGELEKAEKEFRKVIYIDSNIILAYFNLGNIYLYEKKFSKAEREFKNAIKLLKNKSKEDTIRFGEVFTVAFLLRACRKNLEEIERPV